MLKTPLGNVYIKLNGEKLPVVFEELNNKENTCKVDSRYKATIGLSRFKTGDIIIEFILQSTQNFKSGPNSGEDLAAISFWKENLNLCIGVEGDIPKVQYKYLRDRIKVTVHDGAGITEISTVVAWTSEKEKETGYLNAWLAADPNYNKKPRYRV